MQHTQGRFDVCIIGAGFAGSVLANELASTGKSIAVVEAGAWEDRAETLTRIATGRGPARDTVHTPISVHGNVDWARGWTYAVGGHSKWGAYALRALESHFRMRSLYGVGEDWPFGYDELEPFYCRAEEELGVSGDSGPSATPRRSRPYPMPPFPISFADSHFAGACQSLGISVGALPMARNRLPHKGRQQCCLTGTCAYCPTTAKYRADLVHVPSMLQSRNVTLFPQRAAGKLVLGADGRVEQLLCHLPDRTSWSVSAGIYVVACNAIESSRLLLTSAGERCPGGLANRSGVVGRFLTDHLISFVVGHPPTDWAPLRTAATVISRHFEDGPQRRERAGFQIVLAGRANPVAQAGVMIEDGLFGVSFRDALAGVQRVSTQVEFEMLPVRDNGIELAPSTPDRFGRPGLRLTINKGAYEERARAALRGMMEPILRKMGCDRIAGPPPSLQAGTHSMGTVRMGKSADSSAVDINLRAHDVPNLYVASSAVYPNSIGATNPTLTLVALTLRLAQHLRKEVLQ